MVGVLVPRCRPHDRLADTVGVWRRRNRYFHDEDFVPDGDAGRDSRVAWTGSEFVAVNDNIVAGPPEGLDIHVRRLDASGNSHLAAGWGPWNELNLSDLVPGEISTNPDIANQGLGLAVIWVQEEPGYEGRGRIWFSFVVHR